jgi:hypothetical protein
LRVVHDYALALNVWADVAGQGTEPGQQIKARLEIVVEGTIDQVQARTRARPEGHVVVRRKVVVEIEVERGHVGPVADDQLGVRLKYHDGTVRHAGQRPEPQLMASLSK